MEIFQEFFTSDVWKLLCEITNLNAATKIANDPQNNKGHWSEVSLQEMKAFFGLVIAMGSIKLPAIDLYWKKDKWVFDVPSFNKVMSRSRFKQIWRYLHFCNEQNASQLDDPEADKLYKIRPLLQLLLEKFESL